MMSSAGRLLRRDDERTLTCDARELSLIAGIDEETLHRYELLGLLQRDQGRYTWENLVEVQRTITMELLGFDASGIRDGLSIRREVKDELHVQLELWKEKRRRLSHLVYFLEQAEQVNSSDDARDWHYLGRVVMALRSFQDLMEFRAMYVKPEGQDKPGTLLET